MLHYLRLKLLATLIRLPLALKSLTSTSGPKPDETIQIPSRDSGRGIKAHVYKAALDKYPKPVLINFHGSGFVFPLHGDDDEFCRYISENTSYTVVDVAYRCMGQSVQSSGKTEHECNAMHSSPSPLPFHPPLRLSLLHTRQSLESLLTEI